jgi:hypothetical protein
MRKRNSKTQKAHGLARASASRWSHVGIERAQGDFIGKDLPPGAVPALARLGMVVLTEIETGVITAMTSQHCIVQYRNGKEDALRWGEVWLVHVEPDPAQLAATPKLSI